MNKLPVFNYHITNETQERLDVYIDGGIVDAESQKLIRDGIVMKLQFFLSHFEVKFSIVVRKYTDYH